VIRHLLQAILTTAIVLLFAYSAGVVAGAFGAGYRAMCSC
jgi:hypothetical protein